jgi:hypothetical protein
VGQPFYGCNRLVFVTVNQSHPSLIFVCGSGGGKEPTLNVGQPFYSCKKLVFVTISHLFPCLIFLWKGKEPTLKVAQPFYGKLVFVSKTPPPKSNIFGKGKEPTLKVGQPFYSCNKLVFVTVNHSHPSLIFVWGGEERSLHLMWDNHFTDVKS